MVSAEPVEEDGIEFLQNSAVNEIFTFVITLPVSFLIKAPNAIVVVPVAIVPKVRLESSANPKLYSVPVDVVPALARRSVAVAPDPAIFAPYQPFIVFAVIAPKLT